MAPVLYMVTVMMVVFFLPEHCGRVRGDSQSKESQHGQPAQRHHYGGRALRTAAAGRRRAAPCSPGSARLVFDTPDLGGPAARSGP
mmetsp:Transcript_32407/g.86692  ORF Transcript_32407/g.86692 Transcript_32407/m.86692 type:complete len:86 (+) Transcript_32407:267-524(+)